MGFVGKEVVCHLFSLYYTTSYSGLDVPVGFFVLGGHIGSHAEGLMRLNASA